MKKLTYITATGANMSDTPKYQHNQPIRARNETKFGKVFAIVYVDRFYYDIEYREGNIVHRLPEEAVTSEPA